MQHEQVNEKAVALSIKGAKLTGRLLAEAMRAFLKKVRDPITKHGKQSLRSLSKQGASLDNVEISGEDIGCFKQTARKYNIDFALKCDKSKSPPNWIVFFKAKDSKALYSTPKTFTASDLSFFRQAPTSRTPNTQSIREPESGHLTKKILRHKRQMFSVSSIEAAFSEFSKATLKQETQKPSMLKRLEQFKELAKSVDSPVKNRERGGREL